MRPERQDAGRVEHRSYKLTEALLVVQAAFGNQILFLIARLSKLRLN